MTSVMSNVGRRVEAALRAALPGSVDVELEPSTTTRGGEFRASIRGSVLRVEWVGHAWLSTIEEILGRPEPPDIIVGHRVSPASRQSLAEAGIGWVETTGAAEIDTGFLIISKSGEPRLTVKGSGSWTPAILGTAEAILMGVEPTVAAMHEATGLSVGTCTKALRRLADMHFLRADAHRGPRSARRVVDHAALLDAYVEAAHELNPALALPVGVSWRDPVQGLVELGEQWDLAGVPWVASGLVAAAVVAPLVTSVGTANVYVPASTIVELELAASQVGLRPLEGGRLVLAPLPTRPSLELASVVDGLRVVPWPRLVADLRRSGVRGEEAAEHVREVSGG